jgi:hypothetical protein
VSGYQQKDGQGSLFKNTRKEAESHPDYNGSITINGVEHWLSAWINEGKNGKFMKLSIGKPKEQRSTPQAAQVAKEAAEFSDDIPF